MFNTDTIKDKLFRLEQNSDFIEDLITKRSDELRRDRPLYNGLEHLLQISIEIIVDVGSHLIAEGPHDTPPTYEKVILALGEYGIVERDFAKVQASMAKFRNLLVHDYDKTMLIPYSQPRFISQVATDSSGHRFCLTFSVISVEGALRARLISAEYLPPLCLAASCPRNKTHARPTSTFSAFTASPYFSLEFLINSQPTRAPSFAR